MEREYEVIITRTFVQRCTVTIEAEDAEHAKSLVESLYYDGDYDDAFTDMEAFNDIEFETEDY